MRSVQRASAVVGWLAFTGIGAAMMLEAVGVINETWREFLSSVVAWVANPGLAMWVATLLGAVLAAAAVLVVAAQVAPARRRARGVTIDHSPVGTTDITSSTLYRAVVSRLATIPDVYAVKPKLNTKRLRFVVEVTDRARLDDVAEHARDALDASIWSMLGIDPRPVDLILSYRRGPTPVSRKELLI